MALTQQNLSSYLRRKKALGLPVSQREISMLTEPALRSSAMANVESAYRTRGQNIQERGLSLQETGMNRAYQLEQDRLAQEKRSATLKGAVDVGMLAYQARKPIGQGLQYVGRGIEKMAGGTPAPATTEGGAATQASSSLAAPAAGTTAIGESQLAGAGNTIDAAGNVTIASANPTVLSSGTTTVGETGISTTGGMLGQVGVAAAGGMAGGFVGQKLTKAGEPGHMGGERITGGAIGAGLGIGATALMMTNPITAPIAIITGIIGALGGSGSSIICTELHRQGYMPKEMLDLEYAFKIEHVEPQVYAGYIVLATPIVKVMRESKLFTWLVSKIAMPWGHQMCHMVRPDKYKENKFGKFIMKVGFPLCRWKGKMTEEVA